MVGRNKCCDPFSKHKRGITSHTFLIKDEMKEKFKLNPNIQKGKYLCVNCIKELNVLKKKLDGATDHNYLKSIITPSPKKCQHKPSSPSKTKNKEFSVIRVKSLLNLNKKTTAKPQDKETSSSEIEIISEEADVLDGSSENLNKSPMSKIQGPDTSSLDVLDDSSENLNKSPVSKRQCTDTSSLVVLKDSSENLNKSPVSKRQGTDSSSLDVLKDSSENLNKSPVSKLQDTDTSSSANNKRSTSTDHLYSALSNNKSLKKKKSSTINSYPAKIGTSINSQKSPKQNDANKRMISNLEPKIGNSFIRLVRLPANTGLLKKIETQERKKPIDSSKRPRKSYLTKPQAKEANSSHNKKVNEPVGNVKILHRAVFDRSLGKEADLEEFTKKISQDLKNNSINCMKLLDLSKLPVKSNVKVNEVLTRQTLVSDLSKIVEENMKLKQMNYNTLTTCNKLEPDNNKLRGKFETLKKQSCNLKKNIRKIKSAGDILKKKVKALEKKLEWQFYFIDEFNKINPTTLKLMKNQTNQFTQDVFEFADTVHSYSPQAYKYLAKYLWLPTRATILRRRRALKGQNAQNEFTYESNYNPQNEPSEADQTVETILIHNQSGEETYILPEPETVEILSDPNI